MHTSLFAEEVSSKKTIQLQVEFYPTRHVRVGRIMEMRSLAHIGQLPGGFRGVTNVYLAFHPPMNLLLQSRLSFARP
jgi:hypothetical protein